MERQAAAVAVAVAAAAAAAAVAAAEAVAAATCKKSAFTTHSRNKNQFQNASFNNGTEVVGTLCQFTLSVTNLTLLV